MSDSPSIQPPRLLIRFLRWFCHPELIEDVEGDLLELFEERIQRNPSKAKLLFFRDVIQLIRPGMLKNFSKHSLNNSGMIKNYFKVAFRNAMKQRSYTLLNLFGLIIGVTSSILILLWVDSEFQMDKSHKKGDRTYEVWRNMHQSQGEVITTASVPQPLEKVLEEEYPEIESVALLSWEMESLFAKGEQTSLETGCYASPEFLDIFDFKILKGNNENVLDDLSGMMISDRIAEKYFGENWQYENNIVGQSFRLDDQNDFKITGVFESPKSNSSYEFDWLIPAERLIQRNAWIPNWGNGSFGLFITLKDVKDEEKVASRMEQEINNHTNHVADERLILQKFQDTYLYSDFEGGVISGGRIDYVRIMLIVAIFILLIACINFMNLVTAGSNKRSKEVGLRKVMGARKWGISIQFFVESYLLTFLAVCVSIGLVFLLLPLFNELIDKSLVLDFTQLKTPFFFLGIILVTGFLSGIYPAILLPAFKIINSLKGTVKHPKGTTFFRKGLVVFQFAISILLIIGTAVIYQQMNFVLNKDLGLNQENIVLMEMEGDLRGKYEVYKEELLKIPGIDIITAASGNPVNYGRTTGSAIWEGKSPSDIAEINVINVSDDFIETLGMKMASGRFFSEEIKSDSSNYVINEVAAKIMGFEDPIGKSLSIWGMKGRIIGVVKNFHMKNLHQPIAPLVVRHDPRDANLSMIKINGDMKAAIKSIEKVNTELNPSYPFRFQFMDDSYAESYKSEQIVSNLINVFALISIFISCLGLFGLSAFSANQRSKEIGVRKVHGAGRLNIVFLLSKDFAKLIIIAFMLASPFAWYFIQQWLEGFQFRTEMSFLNFVIAGLVTLVIGGVTVSFKSYQVATVNPVESLKSE